MKTFILVVSVVCATAITGWGYSRESQEEESQEAAMEAGQHPGLVPVVNWTGYYVGIQTSYTRASSDTSLHLGGFWNDFPDIRNSIEDEAGDEFDENGFGLGGCAGYNYEFKNGVVLGVGIAGRKLWGLDGMHETGDFPVDNAGDFDVQSWFKTTYVVTLGPKVGFACGRFFPYATGGIAFGEHDYRQRILSSNFIGESTKGSEISVGWNAGVGVQYAFANHWSLKVEYGYTDLGTLSVGRGNKEHDPHFGMWSMGDLTEHTGNFGIVYNFASFAPH
jgi:outer membrane immunogenic protein